MIMTKVEIVVPEIAASKVDKYACECQKKGISMGGKEAKVFWVAKLMDYVKCEEVLCELETQKTIVEIKSPCDGRLVEICIEDNGDCTMGSVLGYLVKENG